jgi:DNA-binding MarR family transcriptional regulator
MRTNYPIPKYALCSLTTRAAKQLVAYYNHMLAPLGITAQQMMALGVLWRKDNISLGVFAGQAGIGKAAAVTMIRRLEVLGLITQETNPKDARLNAIKLTPKAWELLPKVAGKVNKLERKLEKDIGSRELKTLIKGLSTLRDLDVNG